MTVGELRFSSTVSINKAHSESFDLTSIKLVDFIKLFTILEKQLAGVHMFTRTEFNKRVWP